jgi:hypothetical protein
VEEKPVRDTNDVPSKGFPSSPLLPPYGGIPEVYTRGCCSNESFSVESDCSP